jgi:hypothetical protein
MGKYTNMFAGSTNEVDATLPYSISLNIFFPKIFGNITHMAKKKGGKKKKK